MKTAIKYAETAAIIAAVTASAHYNIGLDWSWAFVVGAASSILLRPLIHGLLRSRPVAEPSRRVRIAALFLIAGLVAGPLGTHVYWLLGGSWGLYTDGVQDEVASTGIRVLAAVVVVLLMAAVLVVLARVGWWPHSIVPARFIQFFAWALAVVFVAETLASFTWGRPPEWWLYGPVSLVLGVLALYVAGSGGAWPGKRRSPDSV